MSPLRIAMWSGPRNISTAMMRAWENRQDCEVWDEPLYGYYLKATGLPHPGAGEIIADHGSDWKNLVARCSADSPAKKPIFFQKHMTLHLLPEIDRGWMSSLRHCFLIRKPEPVIASYSAVRGEASLKDIGFVQQAELFDYVCEISGQTPPVIDSSEFLLDPEAMLRTLCAQLQINFDPAMLSWPEGPRDSDGIWAKHWYDSVWKSSGFAAYQEKPIKLDSHQQNIAEQALPYYQHLYKYRLRAVRS